MRAPSVDTSFFFSPRPPQLPYALSMQGRRDPTARLDGGGRDRATVVCGFLGLDARPFNPLLAALPRVLPDSRRARWAPTPGSRPSCGRSSPSRTARRPGGEAVLERMSEMLFVEVLRRYVDSLPPEQTGWLAGMRDPAVGRALSLLHEKPAEPWTLERLGEEAGLSRSSLHERFVHFIGQPPMQYLTQWRMQVASGLLRDTNAKLVEVALDVGYESEAAFSRAFKRVVGVSPGRGERRSGADSTLIPMAGFSGWQDRGGDLELPRVDGSPRRPADHSAPALLGSLRGERSSVVRSVIVTAAPWPCRAGPGGRPGPSTSVVIKCLFRAPGLEAVTVRRTAGVGRTDSHDEQCVPRNDDR